MAAPPLFFKRRDGLLEALAQLQRFAAGSRPAAAALCVTTACDQLVARAAGAQPLEHRPTRPRTPTTSAMAISRAVVGLERLEVGERKVRAGEPDEQRDQDKAEKEQEPAALEQRHGHGFTFSRTWMISTRRLRARFSGIDSG